MAYSTYARHEKSNTNLLLYGLVSIVLGKDCDGRFSKEDLRRLIEVLGKKEDYFGNI